MTPLQRDYREASIFEAGAITDLVKEFHAESWQRSIEFDWDMMCEWVRDRVDCDGSLVLGCWSGSDLAGAIIGLTTTYPYSNTLVAGDYIWYVRPEYRGTLIGFRLMKMFEEWARGVGASQILTGATSGIKTDRSAALLERLGYVPTGTSTYKDV